MQTTAAAPSRATLLLTSAYENGRLKGHLLGLLDLAQELVSRGHRVLVYTEASARADVEASGAELLPHQNYRDIGARMDAALRDAPRWAQRSRLLRGLYITRSSRRAMIDSTRELAEELEPLLRREQVDCVVYDYSAYAAAYAAERVGIPAISVANSGLIADPQGMPLLLRMSGLGRLASRLPGLVHRIADVMIPMKQVRKALGLPPRKERQAEILQLVASPLLHIITLYPGLVKDHSLRDNQLFAGPMAFNGQAREETPPPLSPPLAPGTILVSTTTVGGDFGLLRKVLEALAPLGLPVLATSAGSTDVPEGLGPHIRVERFVPHEQVLPHVAALVTHGGVGVMGRALRHGVPTLTIPLFSDQPINARLMEAQGLAYHLPFRLATPEAIRERVQALLRDQALHERLKQTARELQEARPKEEVLEAIERLAHGSARRKTAA